MNGIPLDLLETYQQNIPLYEQYGKPPPRHYDETVPGQVTVTSYAEPDRPITIAEGLDEHFIFEPGIFAGVPAAIPVGTLVDDVFQPFEQVAPPVIEPPVIPPGLLIPPITPEAAAPPEIEGAGFVSGTVAAVGGVTAIIGAITGAVLAWKTLTELIESEDRNPPVMSMNIR